MLDLMDNFIGATLTILTAIYFVKFILHEPLSDRKISSIIFLFCVAFIISILNLILVNYLFVRTLISCVLYMSLFKYLFRLTLHETILYLVSFVILLTISEMIVFLIIVKIISMANDYLYNIFAGSILSNVIVSLCFLIITYILRRWIIKLTDIKIKNRLTFHIVLLFICIIFFFYVTFSNIGNGINLFSGLMVIIILLIVVINLLLQAYRNNELTIKYDKLLEFIKKYEVEIDNQRTMRHEIKNQLLTIKSKIIDKDKNQNIISYIDEILEDNSKVINHVEYAKLNYLPPNGIKGLFYFKVSEALDSGIEVSINISKDIENSLLNDLNSNMFNQVGKLFGILLDNAIEAAEIAHEKKMGIEIYVVNNKVNFIISNTYIGGIATSKGAFSRSTKGENRGHGLLLAKAIVNSNNRFEIETTITDVLYIQKLIIK